MSLQSGTRRLVVTCGCLLLFGVGLYAQGWRVRIDGVTTNVGTAETDVLLLGLSRDIRLFRSAASIFGIDDNAGGTALTVDVSGADPALTFGDVTITRDGAANTLSQRNGTNAQRLNIANTWISATNRQDFSVDWQTVANVALVGTRTAATGSGRRLQLVAQGSDAATAYMTLSMQGTNVPMLTSGFLDSSLGNISNGLAGTWFSWGNVTHNGTSGTVINTAITPTYNQASGTAANTDLLIQRTETAVGSGAQYLIQAGTAAAATRFTVTAAGLADAVSYSVGGAAGVSGTCASVVVTNGLVTTCTP